METGDVIILPFFGHQEDKTQGEPRWAIILEDLGDSFSVIPMTCQVHQESHYTKTIRVDLNTTQASQMRITCDSIIIIDREVVLPKVIMSKAVKVRGRCPDELVDEIFELYHS